MRRMTFREHSLERCVHWRKTPVVADLKNSPAIGCRIDDGLRLGNTCGHGFFAEHMLACPGRGDGYLSMFCVWRSDINSVAVFDDFPRALDDGRATGAGQCLGRLNRDVVDGGNMNSFVAEQNSGMHSANVARANDADFDFVHKYEAGACPLPDCGYSTVQWFHQRRRLHRYSSRVYLQSGRGHAPALSLTSKASPPLPSPLAPTQTDRAPNTQAGIFPRW